MSDFAEGARAPKVDDVTSSLLHCVREAYGPAAELDQRLTRSARDSLSSKDKVMSPAADALSGRAPMPAFLNFDPIQSESGSQRKTVVARDGNVIALSQRGTGLNAKESPASDQRTAADDPPAIDFPEPDKGPEKKVKKDKPSDKTAERDKPVEGIAESDKRPSPMAAIGKLKEIPELTKLIDTLKDKGIEAASFEQTKDGKLLVRITNEKARHVELNEKLGFGTVKSVDIAKDVTYTISKTEKGLKIEDLKGISAQVNILGKDITQQLPGASIERDKDGKPVENQLSKISAKLGLDNGEMLKFTDMLFEQGLKGFEVRKAGEKGLSMQIETTAGTKADVDMRKVKDNVTNVQIRRNDSDHIPLNKKEGPVTVHGLDIGKNISFDLVQKGNDISFANLRGVSLNVSILKERDLQVKSVTVHHDKEGKPESATADISRPILKNRTKTVTVPLKDQ